jgi:hypothetical protein
MKRVILFNLLVALVAIAKAQVFISGVVMDIKGQPIFAANVYPKSNPQHGAITDFDGCFKLEIKSKFDTLVVSFIGYQTKLIPTSSLNLASKLVIQLIEKTHSLDEVVVKAQDPISEKFSVVKMKKMDFYLNPVAQGDPLKAITVLPASTTTDETANPSLRGSSADRTRVVLNGVPIYSPVKASMLNNLGFFSLFNSEIVGKQYVYASNPPLTYGNTSAGLVEIQTVKSLDRSHIQLSASLASTGVFLSQVLNKGKSFIQFYGNFQFSDAFVGIQSESLPNIKRFTTKDAGLNFSQRLGKNIDFNSYSYFIDEEYSGNSHYLAFKGDVNTSNRRFFSVNNLRHITSKGVLSLNSGVSTTLQNFGFGIIQSGNTINQLYTGIDYKWYILPTIDIQLGLSHDYHQNLFNSTQPLYYFAISPESASYQSDTTISISRLESYFYSNWNINRQFTLSSGARFRIPINDEKYYMSSQMGLKYSINREQWLLLSGGLYHSYTTPNYYHKRFALLKSCQAALDYSLELKRARLTAAVYFKDDVGEQVTNTFYSMDNVKTFGAEVFFEKEFGKILKITLANSFVHQTLEIEGKKYKGDSNLAYLLKTSVQYINPKLFNLTISYIGRPGKSYTPVVSSYYHEPSGFFAPVFSNNFLSEQYENYNRIDLNLSRYVPFGRKSLVIFASVNNLLNTKNQRDAIFNHNYSSLKFDYYSLRTIYFGLVWQLSYR